MWFSFEPGTWNRRIRWRQGKIARLISFRNVSKSSWICPLMLILIIANLNLLASFCASFIRNTNSLTHPWICRASASVISIVSILIERLLQACNIAYRNNIQYLLFESWSNSRNNVQHCSDQQPCRYFGNSEIL